jgi:hypothetical protein
MRWKTKLLTPVLASITFLVASFFIKVVPCQIAPNVPNPVYSWGFCSLNPDRVSPFGVQNIYWGISSQLTDTYIISLVIIFLVVFGVIITIPKSKHIKKEEKQ